MQARRGHPWRRRLRPLVAVGLWPALLMACTPQADDEPTTTAGSFATTTTAAAVTTTTPATTTLPPYEVDERYWQMRERDIEIVRGDRRVVFDTWFFAQLDDLGTVSVYEADELVFTGRVADSVSETASADFVIRDPESGEVVARVSREDFDAAVDAIAEEFGLSV